MRLAPIVHSMKTFLILLLACVMFVLGHPSALAMRTNWQPCERPQAGELGSGAHSVVKGMLIYSTPPSKPYVVLGLIDASNGMFGSTRTRAVALARKVGADALILITTERFVTGASTDDNGNSQVDYAVTKHYAAIKWTAQDSASALPVPPVAATANPR
jgi:hypothetical protein